MKRREFIQTASYLSVGTLLTTKTGGCAPKKQLGDIGIQLYTIRDAMIRDSDEALRRLAAIGYKYVEGALYKNGYVYGKNPEQFKRLLVKHGLTMPSGHVDWVDMRDDAERAVVTAHKMGQKYLVIPSYPEERRNSAGYKKLINILNTAAAICKEYDIQLAYHNHDYEFNRMVAGQRPYKLLLAETDPEFVKFELDLYWITKAGSDYQEYFAEHPHRFPLWHVKDMDSTSQKFFESVGDGVIDWPEVFNHQQESGMEFFFVEQDDMRPGIKVFDEVEQSYAYLSKMRY